MDTKDKPVWFVDGNRLPGEEDKIIIDFNHSQAFVFELDRNLYKQFAKSIPIKIHTRYPKKKYKPVIDEKKEPEFDVEVQQEMLGFSLLNMKELLEKNSQRELNQRYYVFEYDDKHLQHYSVYWPLKDEQSRITALVKEVEKEKLSKQKKPEDPLDGVTAGKKPAAGGKKPAAVDPKKKKPAGGGKKGKEEDEVKIVVPSWDTNKRTVICYEQDRLARHGINNFTTNQTKLMVAGNIDLAVGVQLF